MHVTLRLKADASLALHNLKPMTPASEELLKAAKELGVAIEPIHPGSKDPHLINYFKVEAIDRADAKRLVARLQRIAAVESAYLKSEDELP